MLVTPRRKYALRYSCAALLVAVSLLAIWLGIMADRVHRQKRLISLLGGKEPAMKCLAYDYQEEYMRLGGDAEEPVSPAKKWPPWLVNAIGEDWFVTVVFIQLPYKEGEYSDELVDALCNVRTLKYIRIGKNRLSQAQANRVLAAHGRKTILDASLQMVH